MGSECKNIFSILRGGGEKRKHLLLEVGERAGQALANILQESSKECLGCIADLRSAGSGNARWN